MTLGDFFRICTDNPSVLIFYFVAVPLTAALAGIFGRREGHLSPWKYLYTVLVYLSCVPGIFSITLSVYQFLFERQSIYDTNMYTQVLPVISMIMTLWLIKSNVALSDVPGFGRLSWLLVIIAIVLAIMWVVDRTYFLSITLVPFTYIIVILIAIFVLLRIALRKLAG